MKPRKVNNNRLNNKVTSLWSNQQKKDKEVEKKEIDLEDEKENQENEMDNKEEKPNKKIKRTKGSNLIYPTKKLEELGGIENSIEEILELIALPFTHPELYLHTGITPPRGILLHGPPGCGKTHLAHAIAGSLKLPLISISAPSIVSGMSGESEKKLRSVFEEAKSNAPCLLFIDEVDAITPKRETAQREMERRIVAQLLTCMDDLNWIELDYKPVIVIGATNRPDALDPALRRAGRFDREIALGVPSEAGREKILKVLCNGLRISGKLDFKWLAKHTPGYVGADLKALTNAAGMLAVKRIFQLLKVGGLEELSEIIDDKIEIKEDEVIEIIRDINNNNSNNDDVQIIEKEEIKEEIEINNDSQEVKEQKEEIKEITKIDDNEEEKVEIIVNSTKTIDLPPPTTNTLTIIHNFLNRYPNPLTPAQLAPLNIEPEDFLNAMKKVQPSSKREGFATVPDVTWSDIGALSNVRDELRMAVVEPMLHPELFASVGIRAPSGVLLWGPPGCGKTLLAKAVANQSASNFISVKGPELLNKYVGESERAIRQVFQRARASQPCVVFFDELDALCTKRDENQSEVAARIVNTLLTELDGAEERKSVFIIAATNRPDIIDTAMLRPGRLDKLLYVALPTLEERYEILKAISKKTPLAEDLDLHEISKDSRCEGFSGADLASLLREASVNALRRNLYHEGKLKSNDMNYNDQDENEVKIKVEKQDFHLALNKILPSVTKKDLLMFEALKPRFGS